MLVRGGKRPNSMRRLSNIGAGMLLIFFKPFKVGDFIQAAGESDVVEGINLFSILL